MFKIFKRLNAKEWGMVLLSTAFICLAVWMDLKTPDLCPTLQPCCRLRERPPQILWIRDLRCSCFHLGAFLWPF